jgi:hypothetical protein
MMSAMRALALALTLTFAAGYARAEERPLFNGKDLSGWTHVGKGEVVVEHGLLKTVGGMGLLYFSGERFGDCVIRVVYRTTTVDDNSGIFVRIPDPPKDAWQAVHTGYEIQILENFPASYVQKPVGEWNTMEIELRGPRTVVRLNGVLVNDFVEGSTVPPREHSYEPVRGRRPDAGYIGIQNHHEPQTVLFREITVIK